MPKAISSSPKAMISAVVARGNEHHKLHPRNRCLPERETQWHTKPSVPQPVNGCKLSRGIPKKRYRTQTFLNHLERPYVIDNTPGAI